MSQPEPRGSHAAIALLVFCSGAITLIYEIAWARSLLLVFGVSVYAVSTVLASFMAGLALGSAGLGRLADGRAGGLRLYAALEAGIGAWALAVPLLLAGLERIEGALAGSAAGPGLHLVRFGLSFLVLLVPTTLMGATLPVLSRVVVRRASEIGHGIGSLYALNTWGAAAGCAAAAFVLLEQLGLRGTVIAAACGNAAIAAAAWLLAQRGDVFQTPVLGTACEEPVPPAVARAVFWGFALSGFAALGYEVVWTRLLSMLLSSTTTQSLSLILTTFLVGLASGGAVGARLADRWRRQALAFGAIELALGALALASIPLLGALPALEAALGGLPSWWGHLVRQTVVVALLVFPPTFLLGLLFPIAGRIHVRDLTGLGRALGGIYAANTAGAIAGALGAGFVLIPRLGTQHTLEALAAINLLVGCAVIAAGRESRRLLVAVAAAVLLYGVVVPRDALWRTFGRAVAGSRLLFWDEGAAGTVTVYESADGERVLRVNGAGEVPTDYASIQIFRLLGTLPLALHPDPREALVVAFGGGITLAAVERQQPGHLSCVELVPGVVRGAPYFARYNDGIHERLGSPALALIAEDGRNHLRHTPERHDVIIGDATHPTTADSWVLYTEDFYRVVLSRLAPGGVFAQWLPLHGLAAEDFRTIVRTFRAVFPHATLWATRSYTVLVATPERLTVDLDRLGVCLGRGDLAAVDLDDPVAFLGTLGLDEDTLANYVGAGEVNTDDLPHVSFTDRKRAGATTGVPAMRSLEPDLITRVPAGMLRGAGAQELGARLERRLAARKHAFTGAIALRVGDRARAIEAFRRAQKMDPGESGSARALAGMGMPAR